MNVLKYLSATDYVTAKRFTLPSRFEVSYTDGTFKTGVTSLNVLKDPNAQLFEDIFRNLEAELPPLPDFSGTEYRVISQKVPDDPLCVVIILYCMRMSRVTSRLLSPKRTNNGWLIKSNFGDASSGDRSSSPEAKEAIKVP